jgi:hypothetical protein
VRVVVDASHELGHDPVRRLREVHGHRPLVDLRTLEVSELRLDQRNRHEVVTAGSDPVRDHLGRAVQKQK